MVISWHFHFHFHYRLILSIDFHRNIFAIIVPCIILTLVAKCNQMQCVHSTWTNVESAFNIIFIVVRVWLVCRSSKPVLYRSNWPIIHDKRTKNENGNEKTFWNKIVYVYMYNFEKHWHWPNQIQTKTISSKMTTRMTTTTAAKKKRNSNDWLL